MNNKGLTYLLLVVVIIAWGYWLYMLAERFNWFGENGNNTEMNDFVPPELPKNLVDTFQIKADYRDPFLGKRMVVANPSQKLSVKPKELPKPVTLSWPSISYSGMIKNQQSNKQLAIVVINGQSNMMKLGSVIAEVTLNKIYRDSIEVTYQKMKKVIKK